MIKLTVTSLNKQFGRKKVLRDLNFSCKSTVLGISGSNGSGKSTLLKCISRLMKPSSGNIEWTKNGTFIKPDHLKTNLGFVAPYVQYYEELTVMENLQFITDLKNKSEFNSPQSLLERFGIPGLSNSLYGELSTGQQQRVKLAGALIYKPDILILDEPGSNLDESGRDDIKKMVTEYSDKEKLLVLASNQQYELDLCDEIVKLTQD